MNLSEFTDLEFFDLRVGQGFSGGSVVKNPPANAVDLDSVSALGTSYRPWSN